MDKNRSRKQLATRDYASRVLGVPTNSAMKNQNGMDDIDRWAEGIGRSERQHRQMTPRRKHVYSA